MALDTTVAGPNADSYISVAEATEFASRSLSGFAASWTAASAERKENALRQATADVDVHIRSTTPYLSTQRLAFPRDRDYSGDPAAPYIEWRVKQATYEQAAYLLANQKLIDDAARRRARAMFSFSEEDGPSGTIAIDPAIGLFSPAAAALLRGLAGTGSGGVRSVPIRSLAYREPFEVLT